VLQTANLIAGHAGTGQGTAWGWHGDRAQAEVWGTGVVTTPSAAPGIPRRCWLELAAMTTLALPTEGLKSSEVKVGAKHPVPPQPSHHGVPLRGDANGWRASTLW